jgi:hypothetical protein
MAIRFNSILIIGLVILMVSSLTPTQLLAQSKPIARVTEGEVFVKEDITEPKATVKIPGDSIFPKELISAQRDKKARIICLSIKVERHIPSDGLYRGVRQFCP